MENDVVFFLNLPWIRYWVHSLNFALRVLYEMWTSGVETFRQRNFQFSKKLLDFSEKYLSESFHEIYNFPWTFKLQHILGFLKCCVFKEIVVYWKKTETMSKQIFEPLTYYENTTSCDKLIPSSPHSDGYMQLDNLRWWKLHGLFDCVIFE